MLLHALGVLLQEFYASGEFSFGARLCKSLKSNIKFYIVVVGLLAVFIIWMMISKSWGFNKLFGFMIACANTYGMLLIVLMLGYGLVEVPRMFWHLSLPKERLVRLEFQYVTHTHRSLTLWRGCAPNYAPPRVPTSHSVCVPWVATVSLCVYSAPDVEESLFDADGEITDVVDKVPEHRSLHALGHLQHVTDAALDWVVVWVPVAQIRQLGIPQAPTDPKQRELRAALNRIIKRLPRSALTTYDVAALGSTGSNTDVMLGSHREHVASLGCGWVGGEGSQCMLCTVCRCVPRSPWRTWQRFIPK